MCPVMVLKTGVKPRSSLFHDCAPPGAYSIQRNVFGFAVVNSMESFVPFTFRNQVLVSPGEMRFCVIVSGNGWPSCGFFAVQSNVALSHVSHGTSLPSLPGRSFTTL